MAMGEFAGIMLGFGLILLAVRFYLQVPELAVLSLGIGGASLALGLTTSAAFFIPVGIIMLLVSLTFCGIAVKNRIAGPAEPVSLPSPPLPPPPPPLPLPGPAVRDLSVSRHRYEDILRRWELANGSIPKLIRYPERQAASPAPNPDVTNYSFDRLLVCDSDAIAGFLIANDFHVERSCAVLSSERSHPQSISSTVMGMLRRNPNLVVYALHNASASGLALAHRLRTAPEWFADSAVPIYDLGLRPRQIFRRQNAIVMHSTAAQNAARQLPDKVRQTLTAGELRWLEDGRYAELETLSPKRLLQKVTQGIGEGHRPVTEADQAEWLTVEYERAEYADADITPAVFVDAAEGFLGDGGDDGDDDGSG